MEHSRGYLHPFLNANLYDNGVGEEIRTVRLHISSHFIPSEGSFPWCP